MKVQQLQLFKVEKNSRTNYDISDYGAALKELRLGGANSISEKSFLQISGFAKAIFLVFELI